MGKRIMRANEKKFIGTSLLLVELNSSNVFIEACSRFIELEVFHHSAVNVLAIGLLIEPKR